MVKRILKSPVDGLMKLERRIEHVFEGGIGGGFGVKLQPVEVLKQLERAMDSDRRTWARDEWIVPNVYEVWLHPDDFAEFSTWDDGLRNELRSHLDERARRNRCRFVGPLSVRVREDDTVRRLDPRVSATISDDAPSNAASAPPPRGDTARISTPAPRAGGVSVVLRGLDGQFKGQSFVLRPRLTTVGRDPSNDIVLEHKHVSRRHATIVLEHGRMQVEDLGTVNGTWIDGEPVRTSGVESGNVIAFAQHRFSVSVGHGRERAGR